MHASNYITARNLRKAELEHLKYFDESHTAFKFIKLFSNKKSKSEETFMSENLISKEMYLLLVPPSQFMCKLHILFHNIFRLFMVSSRKIFTRTLDFAAVFPYIGQCLELGRLCLLFVDVNANV
jgi:hypothetical protein